MIDIATRKVTNHFVLDDATHRYRVNGGAPDPDGKSSLYVYYGKSPSSLTDFVIRKPKYTIIDLAQQKRSSRRWTSPPDTAGGRGGGGRGGGRI